MAKQKVIYYHAGCPVCVTAEQNFLSTIDSERYEIEKVHLGQQKERIAEAERLGVKSVPAVVVGNQVFHINFGANISDLKK